MKKFFLVGTVILLSCVLFVGAGQITVLRIKVQVANAHSEPDSDSKTLKKIPVGTLLEGKSKLGDWYEILITDDQGETTSAYIHAMVVDVVSGEEAPPPDPQPQTPVVTPPPTQTPPPAEPVSASVKTFPKGGFRVFGGFASSNVSTSSIPGFDLNQYKSSRTGFTGGIGFERGSRVAFVLEVLYLPKGAKFTGNYAYPDLGVNVDFDLVSTIGSISVPLMLKIRFMPGSTPYILGGGEVGFITSNELKYTITEQNSGQSLSGTEDLIDGTNKIDYGLVFGLGYELNALSIPLFIEGRYHLGLADIAGTSEDFPDVSDTDSVKTNVLLILVGIRF